MDLSQFGPTSELVQATPEMAPEVQAPEPETSQFALPTFEPNQIDRNIRAITAFEASSRLPALPDEVKTDFATTPGMDDRSLMELLMGLDSDMEEPEEEDSGLILPNQNQLRPTGMEQTQIVLASLSNNPAPQRLTENAVTLWKQQAVDGGYLPEDTKMDESWAPEFNSIRGEMAFDQMNTAMRGDRFGAVPLGRAAGDAGSGDNGSGVLGLLGTFTSPTGLLAAATELDLWVDWDNFKSEASSWGDKWRKLGDSDGVWDFGKNLIDAVTGPIDDVVLPILNVGLLFTGVGAVFNTGRVGWMGARLAESAGVFGRLYQKGGMFTRFVEGAGAMGARNIDEIKNASMTASRLMRSERAVLSKAGDAMAAWRGYKPVQYTKRGVQSGMRLGFAATGESMLPGYQGGGFELGQIPGVKPLLNAPMAGQAAMASLGGEMPGPTWAKIGMSGVMGTLPEILLAPYNIFSPGTFLRSGGSGTNLLSRTGSGIGAALGSAPGRAAIGAVAGATGGVLIGDDAGDIAKGAAAGAAGFASMPFLGHALKNKNVAQAIIGGAVGAGAGAYLGDSGEAALWGGIAGAGVFGTTSTMRQAIGQQVGPSGMNRLITGMGSMFEMSSFRGLAETQEVTSGFDQGMRRFLQGDELQKWDMNAKQNGVVRAAATHWGLDDEGASAAIGFTYVASSLEFIATAQAGVASGAGFTARRLAAKNKLINQLRFFDTTMPSERLVDEVAHAMAWTAKGGANSEVADVFAEASRLRTELARDPGKLLEMANDHNRMAHETLTQLMNPKNFPEVDAFQTPTNMLPMDHQVSLGLGKEFVNMNIPGRAATFAEYLPQTLDSFGNWGKFTTGTQHIRAARVSGILDGAKIKSYTTVDGKTKNIFDFPTADRNPDIVAINKQVTDTMLALDPAAASKAKLTPLAAAFENGRATVMGADKVTKQELLAFRSELHELQQVRRAHETLTGSAKYRAAQTATLTDGAGGVFDLAPNTRLSDLTARQVAVVTKHLKNNGGSESSKFLIKYARRNQKSLADLDMAITSAIEDTVNDSARWAKFGLTERAFKEYATPEGTKAMKVLEGPEALSARINEVTEKANFTAAEIDLDDLYAAKIAAGDTAGAAEVTALRAGLEADGYKLVHGVEFLMPEDLAFGPIFKDMTRRHLNAVTLGNTFQGKLPFEAIARNELLRRRAIVKNMAAIDVMWAPDSQEVDNVLTALQTVLENLQKPLHELTMQTKHQSVFSRTGTRIAAIGVPQSLDDIGKRQKAVVEHLEQWLGVTPKEANALWKATMEFRTTDFQDVGLYAIENWFRQNNQAAGILKGLQGSKYGDDMLKRMAGTGAKGAVQGAAVGAIATWDNDDMSFEDKIMTLAKGAAIGGAARVAASAGLSANVTHGQALVDRVASHRYGYLANLYANLRDSLRFSLSPFFDLSRYTEGHMLAQTAIPHRYVADTVDATGVLRKAGERVVLPGRMDPRAAVRRIAKRDNVSVAEAKRRFDRTIDEFQAISRGRKDFDLAESEALGKYFRSVGILGFDQTAWSATAFHELRRQGFDADASYEAARDMYRYSTRGGRGRSAAEMSANFILFPFSFQKKALGHIGKWLNDDLGRSIIIHDALRTYQELDEQYDLDRRWKEYIPFMKQIQRLNLFAYGISPGVLGGMNSRLLELGGKTAWNMFVPAGLEIKTNTSGEIKDIYRQLAPVLNDITWMKNEASNAQGLWFGQGGMLKRAQIDRGYAEWTEFREAFNDEIQAAGYTWNDVQSKPWLAPVHQQFKDKQAELSARYPAWAEQRVESVGNAVMEQREIQDRRARYDMEIRAGIVPRPDDQMLHDIDTMIAEAEVMYQFGGVQNDSLGQGEGGMGLPPPAVEEIKKAAVRMIRANPSFQRLWDQTYGRRFGPVQVRLTL